MGNQGPSSKLKKLRSYCTKHRPAFTEYGLSALELSKDDTRCMREFILITVVPVPGESRSEKAYRAAGAEIVPFDTFGKERGDELRSQLKSYEQEVKRIGGINCILVVVCDVVSFVQNICPVGFNSDIYQMETGRPWTEPRWRGSTVALFNKFSDLPSSVFLTRISNSDIFEGLLQIVHARSLFIVQRLM